MDDVFSLLKTHRALKPIARDLRIGQQIESKWDVVFDALAPDLRYAYYREGILGVMVLNPVWVSEIQFYKSKFLNKLNAELDMSVKVQDIRVVFDSSSGAYDMAPKA